MKNIPSGLASHIASELTQLAYLLKITRGDGMVLAFTTHDAPLTVDGTTYQAADSFTLSNLETPSGVAPGNAEAVGLISASAITATDIDAGRYDDAAVTLGVCNWADVASGMITLRTGRVGAIKHDGGQYTFELKGLIDRLAQQMGGVYSRTCRHALGNAACGVNVAAPPNRVTGTLTSVASSKQFTDTVRAEADGFFAYGRIQFTSGSNTGLGFDVRAYTADTFTLWSETPFPPQVGDGYIAIAGCDKLHATCGTKFANALNFGGFPHIPGADAVLATPDAKL